MAKLCTPIILAAACLAGVFSWASEEQQESGPGHKPLRTPENPDSYLVCIKTHMADTQKTCVGVLTEIDGNSYILTSQRNLLGADRILFTTLSGQRLEPVRIELSTQRDLARLQLKNNLPGLPLSSEVQMHMPIMLLSPDKEGNDALSSQGTVIGVGGTKIEVTTAFDDEAGGAPILDADGSVVGIASYRKEPPERWTNKGTRFGETPRYFGSRITNQGWKAVAWTAYNGQYGKAYCSNSSLYDRIIKILKESDKVHIAKAEAGALANDCRERARETRKLTEHRDLSDFMLNELEEQAEMLEYADKMFSDYAKKR